MPETEMKKKKNICPECGAEMEDGKCPECGYKEEDGSKEEIIMWADEDCSRDELSALAHEKVMNKFGS